MTPARAIPVPGGGRWLAAGPRRLLTDMAVPLAVPDVGGRKQVSTRMVVVFPAPLGPRNPTI